MFDPVDPKQSFPDLEKGILQYWKEEAMFHRSMHARRSGEVFSFYDGPPFATGHPHYGHLLGGTIKDVIPRYQTMRGKYVERRFGWDCHGLPIENLVEKEHGLKNKRDIEVMGISAFNELCRGSVQRYAAEWRKVVERMGRWVDMDWDYKTMDATYMESIWWVFSELWKKGLIYEGHKPMHICPRCATPLSNFEVTQGYKDRTDQSVIMTFPLVDDPETEFLAWTTTPWSLPGNFWLAVGPDITYAAVKSEGKTYILAKALVEKVFKDREHEILRDVKAKELVGKRYTPLFPYFVDMVIPSTEKAIKPQTYGERVFRVIVNDAVAVSEAEGTGIVHLTSSTGEDSNAVARAEKVDVTPHILIDGSFVDAVTDFKGMNAKPEGKDPMSTDKAVIDNLKKRGRAFSSFTINHSYPHCWRCDTPLIPYVTGSWFVSVEKMKDDILNANAKTEWVPNHLRDGRFGKWLEAARDWAISRNRYWGTPLPIWRCVETGDIEVLASRDEVMARQKIRFTKLTAVRHGESEANVKPRYQGKVPGTDLTERGRVQAMATAKRLAEGDVHVIYASPLARTQQTAQAIAKETGATLITDERLREVDFGSYEGKSIDFSDLALLKAKRQKKLSTNTPESVYHFDGMETWADVQARLKSFFDEILPRHRGEHVVVVTHADPVQNIRHFFTKEDPVKLSHQPYPTFAEPFTFFWDHDRQSELDLHKHIVDGIAWPGAQTEQSVDVTLMRHGETDWNLEQICQGQEGDRPLTEKGKEQAHEAAMKLKKEHFDGIIVSDLLRTRQTAEVIAKELNVSILEQTDLLRERKFGDWVGKKLPDIKAKHPPLVPTGEFGVHHESPPNGETLSQFLRRASAACDYLAKTYPGKKILVVTHGGMVQAMRTVRLNLSYAEASSTAPKNCETVALPIHPVYTRIPEVLDCWFESGSMPYAQSHHPFETPRGQTMHANDDPLDNRPRKDKAHAGHGHPTEFPADFIAEGIDQTRGWFYTLTVLAAALYKEPAFLHCVVNGTVLAEDGRKMSKRLKNYPDPMTVVEKYGADALRFTLMRSPAVRGEDMRFSEKLVEETMRAVVLPLWNAYGFFVTYAQSAKFTSDGSRRHSPHPLDRYIRAEVQDLVNRVTHEFENYDLSATCGEFLQTIDALTNWYIRLSRRRFAGKSSEEGEVVDDEQRQDALRTLYDVLITMSQLLAPFCPFLTDAIYINLAAEDHGSVHLSDWPAERALEKEEKELLARHRVLQSIVSLGLKVRSEKKIKVRQPLAKATLGLPPSLRLGSEDLELLAQELNVKQVDVTDNPATLGERILMVDARKVGPRLGGKVQDVIMAGKRGEFEEQNGGFVVAGVQLNEDEASLLYRGRDDGADIAAEKGIVVAIDTRIDEALRMEGDARDLIRAIQKLRKDQGYAFGEKVTIGIDETSIKDLWEKFGSMIMQETNVALGKKKGEPHSVTIGEGSVVSIFLNPKATSYKLQATS